MKRERLLIIGGTSYVGSNLAYFLSNRYEITLTYRNNQPNIQHCNLVRVDLSNKNPFLCLDQYEKFDQIIWCAQSSDYSQSLEAYENIIDINICGIQKALEFSRLNKAKNFVYLSSGTVYKAPDKLKPLDENAPINLDSYYGFSKYAAEQICQHYALSTHIRITILRLFTVYGPNQKNKIIPRLQSCIRNNQEICLNQNIGMIFNALYIEDLIKIIGYFFSDKTDYKCNTYNIANPELLSLIDVCRTIGEIEVKDVKLKSIDKPILYSIADIKRLENKFPYIKFTAMKEGINNIFLQGLNKCAE